MEPSAFEHEGRARRSGRDQPRGQAERVAQFERGGFLRQDGLGPGFDDEAVDAIGSNQAAGTRRGFENLEGNAPRGELERSRKTRDAGTDDDDHQRAGNGFFTGPGSLRGRGGRAPARFRARCLAARHARD